MAGWHHRLDGRESEQAPGESEGRENLCRSPRGRKESDTTEGLITAHPPESLQSFADRSKLSVSGTPRILHFLDHTDFSMLRVYC